jgi:hypothetical protein
MVVISSEVCGANDIMPERDTNTDVYTHEREIVVIDNDLNIERVQQ